MNRLVFSPASFTSPSSKGVSLTHPSPMELPSPAPLVGQGSYKFHFQWPCFTKLASKCSDIATWNQRIVNGGKKVQQSLRGPVQLLPVGQRMVVWLGQESQLSPTSRPKQWRVGTSCITEGSCQECTLCFILTYGVVMKKTGFPFFSTTYW